MKVYSNHYYTKTVCKGGPHSIMATGYILIHPYKKNRDVLTNRFYSSEYKRKQDFDILGHTGAKFTGTLLKIHCLPIQHSAKYLPSVRQKAPGKSAVSRSGSCLKNNCQKQSS